MIFKVIMYLCLDIVNHHWQLDNRVNFYMLCIRVYLLFRMMSTYDLIAQKLIHFPPYKEAAKHSNQHDAPTRTNLLYIHPHCIHGVMAKLYRCLA